MRFRNWLVCAILALACLPGTLWAANTVLSGMFDGSEERIAPLPGACPGAPSLAYQAVEGIQVTATGSYSVADAFNFHGGGDVVARLYSGSFNPNAPQNNLLSIGDDDDDWIDIWDQVSLATGTNYVLVVQHWCANREAAWAVTFSGPGSVNSASAVATPDFTEGAFSIGDPTADTDCGNAQYQEVGPVQVARAGTYYYADISINYAVDMCLQVYSAPFNPASPSANRVGVEMDDFGVVELEAGEDYYFVAQPLFDSQDGEFFFVLAPPAPLRISHAMAGSWFDPPTSGQGFFMDVFDNSNQLFLAWFTYDLERPDPGVSSLIGEPGHRWMTALGPFSGDTADLLVYWNSGMVFDSADPPGDDNVQDGTMTVEFFDCSTGQVTYDLGTANVQGQVPIQRLANDAVELCESLFEGPGQPGPL